MCVGVFCGWGVWLWRNLNVCVVVCGNTSLVCARKLFIVGYISRLSVCVGLDHFDCIYLVGFYLAKFVCEFS